MESFRKDSLIPLAVAAASVAAPLYFQVHSRYLIGLVLSMIMVAVFAGLPFAKQPQFDVGSAKKFAARPIAISAFIVLFFIVGVGFAVATYRDIKTTNSTEHPSTPSFPTETIKTDSPAPAKQPDTPAEIHAQRPRETEFFRTYIDVSTLAKGDAHGWAYIASDQNKIELPEINAALKQGIVESGNHVVSLFRPTIIRDGKLDQLYSAEPAVIADLGRFCDGIVVGKAVSKRLESAEQQGLVTVELSLSIRAISTKLGTVREEFSVLSRGAGFSVAEAEGNAQQRAAKEAKERLIAGLH